MLRARERCVCHETGTSKVLGEMISREASMMAVARFAFVMGAGGGVESMSKGGEDVTNPNGDTVCGFEVLQEPGSMAGRVG